MNEKIKELWEQGTCTMVPREGDYSSVSAENIKKFAELIIQECVFTAAMFSIENKRIHPDLDPQNMPVANKMVYHATCQSVAQEIKQHFGVE